MSATRKRNWLPQLNAPCSHRAERRDRNGDGAGACLGRLLQVVGQGGLRSAVSLLLVWALAGCSPAVTDGRGQTPAAPAPVCTSTGVCVHQRFSAFYAAHGAIIGEPIAPPGTYRDRLVQYFEAGRLEYVPEYPESYAVGLAYLAEEYCGRQPPLHYRSVPAGHERQARYYRETGHSVRGDFLAFVEANGGVEVLGLPISEPRTVGRETVQDFVRVQLRRGTDGAFYLAPLGRLALSGDAVPEGLCPSVPADDPDA